MFTAVLAREARVSKRNTFCRCSAGRRVNDMSEMKASAGETAAIKMTARDSIGGRDCDSGRTCFLRIRDLTSES